ncbi:MAG: OmpA family protein [Polaromonas sp.]|uniref:OmpA family protein n=1 Tax=Polaromonas sp. TaxID=1869339 RepID=UPI002732D0A2|nr:OmpA family protein [Polaromonas sp.]MDP3798170.1 OmpA family protein [Polaromonas sp.]
MFSQDDDGQLGLVLTVVFGLVALVIALLMAVVIGLRIGPRGVGASSPSVISVAMAVPAAAPPNVGSSAPAEISRSAAQAAADAASVKVEYGVVKFYFASGKADLAAGAGEAMSDLVKAAKSGRKLVVAGFHDATGDAVKNAGLARQRALAVRDALKAAGVAEQQIELKKPEQMTGSGSDADARRVEISVQ